jgi:hypothetical protein
MWICIAVKAFSLIYVEVFSLASHTSSVQTSSNYVCFYQYADVATIIDCTALIGPGDQRHLL